MELDGKMLRQLVQGIMSTRPDEIGCADCFEQLDRFAELNLVGKDAAAALPLVHDHLSRCTDCHEEFQALVAALHVLS